MATVTANLSCPTNALTQVSDGGLTLLDEQLDQTDTGIRRLITDRQSYQRLLQLLRTIGGPHAQSTPCAEQARTDESVRNNF